MVICGQVVLARDRPDTVTNPTLLVEVLSESTREYDRGDKFGQYREIPTLRDYLLIEQDKVFVEHFQIGPNKIWAPTSHDTLSEVVALSSVNIALPLSEVYQQVFKQP
jgi:Uma2 family endonuclease